MRTFLIFFAVTLAASPVHGQMQGSVELSIMPSTIDNSLEAGNETLAPFTVAAALASIYCQEPTQLTIDLEYETGKSLTVSGPASIDLQLIPGPVSGSPVGPLPGFVTALDASDNLTIKASRTIADNQTTSINITALFDGHLPSGCYAAQAPPPNTVIAEMKVPLSPPAEQTSTTSTSRTTTNSPNQDAPGVPIGLLGILLAITAVLNKRRRAN